MRNLIEKRPEAGETAPTFTGEVAGGGYEDGDFVSLDFLMDKPVVLYFYPKDDTSGCTKQACAMRDAWDKIKAKAHVFGVSVDPIAKHRKFIDKHGLPFPLISDADRKIVQQYGVWVEKSMYGRKYWGTERTTFVIGTDGKIAAVLPKVKPAEHVKKVLKAIAELR